MGRLIGLNVSGKMAFVALTLSALVSAIPCSAQWVRTVYDPYCIGQVTANTAEQATIETVHNHRLDSITDRQKKIAAFTTAIATFREAYKYTLENVAGFGSESRYYLGIARYASDIVAEAPGLISAVNDSKMPGKIMVVTDIGNLYERATMLVKDFVDIVNNGRIENPLAKADDGDRKRNDGHNFLKRNDRLTMANRILTDLVFIRAALFKMKASLKYSTWSNVVFKADIKTWQTLTEGKIVTDNLINEWKRL